MKVPLTTRSKNFKKVMTMEYRPNSVFAFVKTERAFHGVDKIAEEGVVRDVLLYNLYLRKSGVGEASGTVQSRRRISARRT